MRKKHNKLLASVVKKRKQSIKNKFRSSQKERENLKKILKFLKKNQKKFTKL